MKLTFMYSPSVLLFSAVIHTFVYCCSNFWNPSYIKNVPRFYRKKMGFTLYSLSGPGRTEKCILQKCSQCPSNNTALPKYNQNCLQIAKTASAVSACYGIPYTVFQPFCWKDYWPEASGPVENLAGKCLPLTFFFIVSWLLKVRRWIS